MKKLFLIMPILFVGMYGYGSARKERPKPVDAAGNPLRYDKVEFKSSAKIPMEISWAELDPATGKGQRIVHVIPERSNKIVEFGTIGPYLGQSRVSYKPIMGDEEFVQSVPLDVQSAQQFYFYADTLMQRLNSVWSPVVYIGGYRGQDHPHYQYLGFFPSELLRIFSRMGRLHGVVGLEPENGHPELEVPPVQ